jgi:hypothetical protein
MAHWSANSLNCPPWAGLMEAGMRPLICLLFAACALAMSAPAHAQARVVPRTPDNIRELFLFLYQCARIPPGTEGSELTMRFSLTHYGALRGKPMITYSKLVGNEEDQRVFVSAALDTIEKCTPVPVTEHLGKVIGQKMIFLTFPPRREKRA